MFPCQRLSYENPFLHLKPLSVSHNLFSTTSVDVSDKQSFTISYFTNTCGFSPQAALKASNRVHFGTAKKPDSVIAFFRNHGFSISQTHSVIGRVPELLVSDPNKRILPKFQFLASKGASASDIVTTVTRNPGFLRQSLENQLIPAFEFVRTFFPSDEKALACLIRYPTYITDYRVERNINLLLDLGVSPSNIKNLLHVRPCIIKYDGLGKTVEELKGLGFDPSKIHFSVALLAKRAVTKPQWEAKVDVFKTWGLSQDAIIHAFRRQPSVMLRSPDKLNAVMDLWVGKLGWDLSKLLAAPVIFGFSLEKRLIPRASVVRYLLSKGLMKKDASLTTPFSYSDKIFLQRFVKCFQEEETSRLLRLYQGAC